MKHAYFPVLALALALALSSCGDPVQQAHDNPKETTGILLGGAAGGLLGSQFGQGSGKLAATGAGVLIGAFLGGELGHQLDEADKLKARNAQAAAYAAPLNRPIAWNNPNTGHSGTVVAVRDGNDLAGNYCREFQSTINVAGQQQQGYGQACRQPDGTWKIVH